MMNMLTRPGQSDERRLGVGLLLFGLGFLGFVLAAIYLPEESETSKPVGKAVVLLVFALAGAGMTVAGLWKLLNTRPLREPLRRNRRGRTTVASLAPGVPEQPETGGEVPLSSGEESSICPGGRVRLPWYDPPESGAGVLLVMTLFWWSGIILMAWRMWDSYSSSSLEWVIPMLLFELVFFIPFTGMGLLLLYLLLRKIVAMDQAENIWVEVSAVPLFPGRPVTGSLHMAAPSPVSDLQVTLLCREEASSCADRSEAWTDKEVVFREPLLEHRKVLPGHDGCLATWTMSIPADAMHSFSAPANRICWLLEVRLRSRTFFRMNAEFELQVAPGARV